MQFPTTRWDQLAEASLNGGGEARQALDEFCRRYWEPVNEFIRWKGYSEADAKDLTQDFFLNFIETRSWRRADPLRGNFRTFLLGALTNRLYKAHAHRGRQKRGGGETPLSLEGTDESGDPTVLPSIPPTAAAHFDRAWALHVLTAALAKTREGYSSAGKQGIYETLKVFLALRQETPSYEEAAAALKLSLGTVKTEIHRLRQSFRAAMRNEIAQTVSAPHEIEEELRHLREVLSNHLPSSDAAAKT